MPHVLVDLLVKGRVDMVSVGDSAPGFSLRNQNNQEISLSSFLGSRSVLLVFYPLAFTGTCQGELGAIQNNLDIYQNSRVQVLTVSVDSVFSHKVWADREGFDFPLLADFWPHGAVASSYGVFDAGRGTADRGTFIISPDGIVRFAERIEPGRPRDQSAWRAVLAELGASARPGASAGLDAASAGLGASAGPAASAGLDSEAGRPTG